MHPPKLPTTHQPIHPATQFLHLSLRTVPYPTLFTPLALSPTVYSFLRRSPPLSTHALYITHLCSYPPYFYPPYIYNLVNTFYLLICLNMSTTQLYTHTHIYIYIYIYTSPTNWPIKDGVSYYTLLILSRPSPNKKSNFSSKKYHKNQWK